MYNKQISVTLLFVFVWLFIVFPCAYGQNKERASILYHQALSEKNLQRKVMLYKQAIKENRQFTEAFVNLGDTYEKLGQWDNAIRYYSKAVETNPKFPIAYFGMGDAYLATGQYSRAIESYEKGLRFRPHDRLALAGRSIAKQRLAAYRKLNAESRIDESTAIEYLVNPIAGMEQKFVTRAVRSIAVKMNPRIGIPIQFAHDKYELSQAAKQQLAGIAEALQTDTLKNVPIIVEGHTDDTGSEAYNFDLSLKRARAVREYLCERHGFSPARFSIKGYGESRPVDSRITAQARALNRRVEFVRGQGPL